MNRNASVSKAYYDVEQLYIVLYYCLFDVLCGDNIPRFHPKYDVELSEQFIVLLYFLFIVVLHFCSLGLQHFGGEGGKGVDG